MIGNKKIKKQGYIHIASRRKNSQIISLQELRKKTLQKNGMSIQIGYNNTKSNQPQIMLLNIVCT